MTPPTPGLAEAPHEFEFDFDTYVALDEAGVFRRAEGDVQLLEGKLIEMPSARAAHSDVVARLATLSLPKLRPPFRLLFEPTIRMDGRSAPEPDAAVVHAVAEGDYYGPSQVSLVFEAGYSSLGLDLDVKARVYARGRIPEYWVADVDGRALYVHRSPGDDRWASVDILSGEQTVSPLFAPEIAIPVKDLF